MTWQFTAGSYYLVLGYQLATAICPARSKRGSERAGGICFPRTSNCLCAAEDPWSTARFLEPLMDCNRTIFFSEYSCNFSMSQNMSVIIEFNVIKFLQKHVKPAAWIACLGRAAILTACPF